VRSTDDAIRATPTLQKPHLQRPIVILWSIFAVVFTVAAVLWMILILRW
jgi:hypothetical protein